MKLQLANLHSLPTVPAPQIDCIASRSAAEAGLGCSISIVMLTL